MLNMSVYKNIRGAHTCVCRKRVRELMMIIIKNYKLK